ncbi:conserved hypothetical protein [Ixodes scapularis]|uniref:Uncharacterized protein n=1 Tax=Ixodes scapularis TaxID=6945 RepID=B7PJK3_IXOSC|nr:conserved hypothetical protein [Ixodes scapularis]|eukprot:XP_002408246.1 conserved hypothetical protein [Ixodes scapularis]
MGSSGSTRRVTIVNENSPDVIKISDSVVKRLKGESEAITASSAPRTTASAPYDTRGSGDVMQTRKLYHEELKKVDDAWRERLAEVERQNQELYKLATDKFAGAVNEVEQKYMKHKCVAICEEQQHKVLECYQKNQHAPLNCSKEKQEKDAMAEAYRQANAKAIVEVNALHQNMMYFKEDHLRKVKELEGLLHKAEEHRRKCEFVKVECQKRVSLLEKESQLKSDRILQLQSRASAQAIIHVTGLATSGIAPEATSVPPHIAVLASI